MGNATERLGAARYVSLATFRRDGREVRTPVWVASDGGRLYVFSEGDAGKVKRIRATRRVAVAPCDARGRLKGDFTGGSGRIVREPDVTARGYAALRRKYGWQMAAANFLSTLTGRIGKRALLELELRD
jgi:PPOX class probable F420-dependent enzyme